MCVTIQTGLMLMVATDSPGGPPPAGPVPGARIMSFCPHQDLSGHTLCHPEASWPVQFLPRVCRLHRKARKAQKRLQKVLRCHLAA